MKKKMRMRMITTLVFYTILLLGCKKDDEVITDRPYNLVWEDNFDGSTLNSSNWILETGADGWGNNELQNYTSSGNVEVSNGTLKIVAKKIGTSQNVGNYTSARLNSIPKFMYGKFEVRAKLPTLKGNGLWPAIWMLGNPPLWPDCGEIDIMEYVSHIPHTVSSNLHSKANNHTLGNQITSGNINLSTAENEFHTYGVLWEESYITFYIDDISNVTLTAYRPTTYNAANWPFNKPFYFLFNIAVGGDWGGQQGVDNSIFPATMEIDFIRVYQK